MRWVVWLLLILSAAVGLALLMRFNHGNVAVLWPPYRVDVSVNVAVLALIGLFLAVHLLLVAIGKALDLPAKVREYRLRRATVGARAALRDSVLALFEGRFGRAERLADVVRRDESLGGAAALIAARAAHRMREFARRDRWLALSQADHASERAGLMTEAELALDEHDTVRALAAIERVHSHGQRHIHSLRVALRAYEQSDDWPRALLVLRQLEKRDALDPAAIRGLKARACRGVFAGLQGDAASCLRAWKDLRAGERQLPETVEAAAAAFARCGDAAFAARLLEDALDDDLSANLLALYAGLDAVPARERIERAEQWRLRHGDDPDLTLALGRLCLAEGLWGKAEDFFARSLASHETAAAHLGMAELAESVGRAEQAAEHYRDAARMGGRPCFGSRAAPAAATAEPAAAERATTGPLRGRP